jgi:hypothetical protein
MNLSDGFRGRIGSGIWYCKTEILVERTTVCFEQCDSRDLANKGPVDKDDTRIQEREECDLIFGPAKNLQ